MKTITLLSILAVSSSFAGEPAYGKNPIYDKNPIIPPAPTLYQWFAGGTVGYLIDNDEELYTAHIGVDLPEQLNGWDQALYLEVGYAEFDHSISRNNSNFERAAAGDNGKGNQSDLEFYINRGFRADLHLEIVPITVNYKLEKPLTNSLNAYVGAGLGIALFEADAKIAGMKDSDDDTVFFAQLFGGVLYNVNPSFELYAGLRAIYFEHPEFNLLGETLRADDFGVENVDVSADIGARINF